MLLHLTSQTIRPLFLLLLLAVSFAVNLTAAERPNVVIFLADDAGWGDYHHNGNQQLATPNIDSLAREGVTLDRFFVCPVCSPTRAEFLTGRYHPRTGVRGVSLGQERLNLSEKTLADAFRAAGYATGAFGKWHNGSQWPYHPNARGFQEYFGYTSGHWGEYFDPQLERNGKLERTQGYIVDVCTTEALRFIERHQAEPFFCFIPFTTPHSPWGVPSEDWKRFADKPLTQQATQPQQEDPSHTRCALAMVENQDRNVGRVLEQLRRLKLAENTIVLYFSDNGPNTARWNGGMKGKKGTTDEGGVRSTCFLRWTAKLPAAKVVPEITAAIDLLPTLLSLTGIKRAGDLPLDGRDISPLLLNQAERWPERMIFSTWGGQVSVRTQQYRLDGAGKLFDMHADPGQTRDVSADNPEVTKKLKEAVAAWREEMSDQSSLRAGGGKVDPRPIPVGFAEFPITMLPARDGEPRGGIRRSAAAPNSSYFVNWKKTDDRMEWEVDINTTGEYEVVIDHTCPSSAIGSVIELAGPGGMITSKITAAWDPPLYTNQDTLPRPKGESSLKEFRPLLLGKIKLEKGPGKLSLRALEVTGDTVMDVRRVTLTLVGVK
jgi:arylsulfatase A-like enzyme